MSNNGEKMENYNLIDYIRDVQDRGAGEIILTSIENEGLKKGLDLDLYRFIEEHVKVPLIANGGTSSINDIINFFDNFFICSYSLWMLYLFFLEIEMLY